MSDNVVKFTGQTKGPVPVEKVLAAAGERKLTSVMVIGLTEDDRLYTASSDGDSGALLWLIEHTRMRILRTTEPEWD